LKGREPEVARRGSEPPLLLVKWYAVTNWLLERVPGFAQIALAAMRAECLNKQSGAAGEETVRV
jgi:hypothetical protein